MRVFAGFQFWASGLVALAVALAANARPAEAERDSSLRQTPLAPRGGRNVRSFGLAGADFCVSGGAPVVGDPVIAPDGSIHFLTADSYLHSFEPDGRFRSSYTLDAGVEFGLAERADGALYAFTTRGGLYAWETSGRLRFYRALSTRPLGDPLALGEGRVGVWAQPGQFLAVGAWGEIVYRVPVRGKVTAKAALVGGQVWFVRDNQLLVLEAAWRQHVFDLPGPVEVLQSSGLNAPAYAQVGSSVYQITHKSGVPLEATVFRENVLAFRVGEAGVGLVGQGSTSDGYSLELSDFSGRKIVETRTLRAEWAPPTVTEEAAYFPTGGSVIRLSRDSLTELVLASDPGLQVFVRGSTLATVRRAHLVCGLRLSAGPAESR